MIVILTNQTQRRRGLFGIVEWKIKSETFSASRLNSEYVDLSFPPIMSALSYVVQQLIHCETTWPIAAAIVVRHDVVVVVVFVFIFEKKKECQASVAMVWIRREHCAWIQPAFVYSVWSIHLRVRYPDSSSKTVDIDIVIDSRGSCFWYLFCLPLFSRFFSKQWRLLTFEQGATFAYSRIVSRVNIDSSFGSMV